MATDATTWMLAIAFSLVCTAALWVAVSSIVDKVHRMIYGW